MTKIINKDAKLSAGEKVDEKLKELTKELSEWRMNNLNSKDPYPMFQVDMAWIGTKFAEVHVLIDLMDESIKNLTKAMSNMVRGKK